ncbi:hypothetical protein [Lentzea sp. E54]|uniref:hypothetical protein n=1 Tax=Lentzea xerophila TaxID=3435883 RepID=UPI003DA3AB26
MFPVEEELLWAVVIGVLCWLVFHLLALGRFRSPAPPWQAGLAAAVASFAAGIVVGLASDESSTFAWSVFSIRAIAVGVAITLVELVHKRKSLPPGSGRTT